MKKITFLLFFCLVLSAGAEEINYPLFDDAVSFYLPFDRSNADAEISSGDFKPFLTLGKPVYSAGLRGKALVCGAEGGAFRYRMKKNLTFNRPGTLLFFFKGIDWEQHQWSRVFFTGIEASSGYWGLQMSYGPKNICPCQRNLSLATLYSKKVPDKNFSIIKPMTPKSCDKWHMIAFSWAPGQLRINFDDKPGKIFDISFEFSDEAFPAGGFSVGFSREWKYLIDEYTIYNRRLTQAEITEVYNTMIKYAK